MGKHLGRCGHQAVKGVFVKSLGIDYTVYGGVGTEPINFQYLGLLEDQTLVPSSAGKPYNIEFTSHLPIAAASV